MMGYYGGMMAGWGFFGVLTWLALGGVFGSWNCLFLERVKQKK